MIAGMRRRIKQQFRIELDLTDDRWQLRSRFECIGLQDQPLTGDLSLSPVRETGVLLLQEAGYDCGNRFAIRFRWTTFETGSYSTRLTIYEGDLPGTCGNVPLFGSGFRWMLRFQWQSGRHFQWSLKYGRTYHEGQPVWGTGPDQIASDTIHELGLQMDWHR